MDSPVGAHHGCHREKVVLVVLVVVIFRAFEVASVDLPNGTKIIGVVTTQATVKVEWLRTEFDGPLQHQKLFVDLVTDFRG